MATSGIGPGKTCVTIYLSTDLLKRIDRVAAGKDRSRSKFLEDLISDGLGQEEVTMQALTDPVVAPAMFQALGSPGVLSALLATMRTSLTDEQLLLFQQAMNAAGEQLRKRGRKGERTSRGTRPIKRLRK